MLAVMMILTLAAPIFAETRNGTAENGSITINGVSENNTYEIYKLLDLESYNEETGAYSYKVNSAWAGFLATDDAKAYMTVDEQNYVTWVANEDDATVAAFAKLALAYAKANGIAPVQSSKNEGKFVITTNEETGVVSGKFSGLELGYYLVDSTMGALCGLTTTNPDASINAKNGIPKIDKQVKEDSTNQWGDTNSADIGQTVEFRVTINVHAGAQNYVLHDIMSAGLTFNKVTAIRLVIPGTTDENGVLVDASNYSVYTKEGLTESTDDDVSDTCTFEVRFSDEFCNTLETNNKIVVFYEAMLNRNAVIAGEGNPNETWLDYGEDHHTTHDTTTTYTFGFDIVKTDSQNKLIDGAQFRIYDALTGGNEVAVVLMDDGVTYRRARADETGVPIIVKDGKVRVVGFDNGTYYLEETVAPEGYNKLGSRQKFIISDSNLDATFNDGIFSTGSGVHVVNKTGTMLPETGGLGTTLFILLGGMVVLGSGVVLFAKKRLAQYED